MHTLKSDIVLDAQGLACPMPIVRTKKQLNAMQAGQILEVQATDKGSTADLKAWAESTGHHYLGTLEEGDVLKHYIRKANDEGSSDRKHPDVVNNNVLESKLSEDGVAVIDVREEAEFAFQHIPGAVSIPLGELEGRIDQLNKEADIYVICRTGSRSDLAAQKLSKLGFSNVYNVVPGMSEWKGQTEGL